MVVGMCERIGDWEFTGTASRGEPSPDHRRGSAPEPTFRDIALAGGGVSKLKSMLKWPYHTDEPGPLSTNTESGRAILEKY